MGSLPKLSRIRFDYNPKLGSAGAAAIAAAVAAGKMPSLQTVQIKYMTAVRDAESSESTVGFAQLEAACAARGLRLT